MSGEEVDLELYRVWAEADEGIGGFDVYVLAATPSEAIEIATHEHAYSIKRAISVVYLPLLTRETTLDSVT